MSGVRESSEAATVTITPPLPKRRLKYLQPRYVMVAPAVATLLLLTLFPTIYAVYMSTWDLNLALPWKRLFIGVGNYAASFADSWFHQSLRVSVFYTVSAVGLELLLGMAIALLLSRPLRGIGLYRTVLLLPMTVPPAVVALTWRLMYHPELGILNSLLSRIGVTGPAWLASPRSALTSIVLVDVWQWTPFVSIVLLAGLISLPKEPYEAARIGGARSWQVFWHITLPMLRPILLVVVLIRLLDAVRTFDTIFILTGGGPSLATEIVSVYIYRIGFGFFRMGYASALSIMLLALVVSLTTLLVRAVEQRQEGRA